MRMLRILPLILLGLFCGSTAAFTSSTQLTRKNGKPSVFKKGFELGPVARNGLAYDDITLGQGRRILPGDTVYCYYVGSYAKGPFGTGRTVFDQTTEGQPFGFVVGKGEVIKGWDLGILGGLEGEITPMNVGGKRTLSIPAGLAYGPNEVGPIPANQDLDFELEVLAAGKESDISLKFRLGGYAIALGIPAFILFLVYGLLFSK